MNHEWTRMDTKFDQTTDYTEYTDCLAAGPTVFYDSMMKQDIDIE